MLVIIFHENVKKCLVKLFLFLKLFEIKVTINETLFCYCINRKIKQMKQMQ